MTLKDLVILSNFDDMWDYLISEYADHDNERSRLSYLAVFEKLVDLEPKQNDMQIGIIYSDEHGWCTDGYKGNETYALDFKSWDKWLGMEVMDVTLGKFKPYEIVAHCMWEMTFVSFDEEKIQDEFNELKQRVEEVKDEFR